MLPYCQSGSQFFRLSFTLIVPFFYAAHDDDDDDDDDDDNDDDNDDDDSFRSAVTPCDCSKLATVGKWRNNVTRKEAIAVSGQISKS